jgi:hypothetical protein
LRALVLYCALAFSFFACKQQGKQANSAEVIAEYNGKQLLKSELPQELTAIKTADSSALLNAYIQKWIEREVILEAAEATLSEEQKNKDQLIEEYKNSLLIYDYQQALIKQKLDTGVSEQAITDYYNQNNSIFQLKKNIVKIRYVKIDKKKADLNKLKKWMQNPSPENDQLLQTYAEKQAENFSIDSNWLYLDDIVKEIPLDENYNQQRFLHNNKFISLEENGMLYLLYITDFRIKDALSPIEFEKDKIRDIILYQRKLTFLKDHEAELLKSAQSSGKIKWNQK